MSELLLLGVSHKTAGVALRERLALPDTAAVHDFLGAVLEDDAVREAVALSTCNRTEAYLVVDDAVEAESAVLGTLARRAGIRPTELLPSIYSQRNCDVARHLYRVTCGLESMIVGENEVQGQVKRAYEAAQGAGATGPLTHQLFRAALSTGKRVRSETRLSTNRISVPSVAVDLARDLLGELDDRRVIVLGAGETSDLTAEALHRNGVGTIFVANRRRERALALAERFQGRAVRFDDLPRELERADILVASTASPAPIVGPEELGQVMLARSGRPLLLIDIAVPRDIDPACAEVPGVTLYDIDDLKAVVERRSGRDGEARRAEAIVEEELERFARWLGSREVLPTVAALRAQGDGVVAGVLAENSGRWESASPRDLQRVEAIAHAVVTRVLHEPTVRLKRTGDDRVHARLQLLRELFALDASSPVAASEPERERPAAEVRELRRSRGG